MKIFSFMETKSWDELLFGVSKYPLRYGLGLEVGNGQVVPEIKYFPKRNGEEDPEKLKKEFREITSNVLKRAVDLGLSSLQMETEQTFVITENPKLGGEITSMQKSIMENYAEEYGLKIALRVTIADIRKLEGDMRGGKEVSLMFESFEKVAENGADVISIESIGGKEIFNYSLIRQDIEGVLFSIGVLGSLDMEFLWREITNIANKHGIIAGGDTDCAHGNTAMVLANGLRSNIISHTFAALVRAIGASRSLVAYEHGATGPGKDCGYENIIIKAITGFPISMEGKTSASAHSSLVGNVAAAACDLWSNEQVENIRLYGGWGPQVFLEILAYDTFLMNESLKTGFGKKMRDLLISANPFDPQVLVLAPEGAWKIGEAITRHPKDYYLRAKEACLEALKVIRDGYKTKKQRLPMNETRVCLRVQESCEKFTHSQDAFIEKNLNYFMGKVKNFSKENYGL
jgi:methanol--5-hydroxybenzimidazolylcobamide Co-methyltransferase